MVEVGGNSVHNSKVIQKNTNQGSIVYKKNRRKDKEYSRTQRRGHEEDNRRDFMRASCPRITLQFKLHFMLFHFPPHSIAFPRLALFTCSVE